jgi:TusA-related sulfurtransferase
MLRPIVTDQLPGSTNGVGPRYAARSAGEPESRSILDAGGETGAVLSGSLYRHISNLETGQTLEVISRDPRSRTDVVSWCLRTGHDLVGVIVEGKETVFWITKRG